MKKSTIWLLTTVMGITIGALLYFQIMYLEKMVKMRELQFSESVTRSLYTTAGYLERQETLHYLEQDANVIESGIYYNPIDPDQEITDADKTFSLTSDFNSQTTEKRNYQYGNFPSPTEHVSNRYKALQETIRKQYLYQKGLLNEVILTILSDAEYRPVIERADSTIISSYLKFELSNNGLNVPFSFAISDDKDIEVYSTDGYSNNQKSGVYTQIIFANTSSPYYLHVCFPTKGKYVFSSVSFIIPTLIFTLILIVIFIYTVILAFRQKKLSEMKSDFINNMTHELKTPISTISLAGQMLSDDSVRKSSSSLQHLSQIITEESKRLRFQVEKVLLMSLFDNNKAYNLKINKLDANTIISNIASTFKIKAEKFGGNIECDLNAENSYVNVDEMQFTNVIFNLLDNAIKYRREDVEPQLKISTNDIGGNLEIRITDNGIGLRKEDQKKIFDKFYRVSTGNRHDVKGFGLGLAYVKKMIEMFKGNIKVDSELGSYSTFIITLPLAPTLDNN